MVQVGFSLPKFYYLIFCNRFRMRGYSVKDGHTYNETMDLMGKQHSLSISIDATNSMDIQIYENKREEPMGCVSVFMMKNYHYQPPNWNTYIGITVISSSSSSTSCGCASPPPICLIARNGGVKLLLLFLWVAHRSSCTNCTSGPTPFF